MFTLEGFNNETDNSLSSAHFELGTGKACYGALIAVIGLEGNKSLSFHIPTPTTSVIEVSVKGLRIKRLDAIEYMRRRYTRSLGEPQPGEFYWDTEGKTLKLSVFVHE